MNNKFPLRTVEQDWYYNTFLFNREKNVVVSVTWNPNKKKYEIGLAYISDQPVDKFEEYPFVKSSGDSRFVWMVVQADCDHGKEKMDFYPHHAVCNRCGLEFTGDFRKQAKKQMKTTFPKMKQLDLEEYLDSFKPGVEKNK